MSGGFVSAYAMNKVDFPSLIDIRHWLDNKYPDGWHDEYGISEDQISMVFNHVTNFLDYIYEFGKAKNIGIGLEIPALRILNAYFSDRLNNSKNDSDEVRSCEHHILMIWSS